MPNESSKQLRQRALGNTPFRYDPTLLAYRSGYAWVSDGDKGFIRSDKKMYVTIDNDLHLEFCKEATVKQLVR
jgi:hypothetical protein